MSSARHCSRKLTAFVIGMLVRVLVLYIFNLSKLWNNSGIPSMGLSNRRLLSQIFIKAFTNSIKIKFCKIIFSLSLQKKVVSQKNRWGLFGPRNWSWSLPHLGHEFQSSLITALLYLLSRFCDVVDVSARAQNVPVSSGIRVMFVVCTLVSMSM